MFRFVSLQGQVLTNNDNNKQGRGLSFAKHVQPGKQSPAKMGNAFLDVWSGKAWVETIIFNYYYFLLLLLMHPALKHHDCFFCSLLQKKLINRNGLTLRRSSQARPQKDLEGSKRLEGKRDWIIQVRELQANLHSYFGWDEEIVVFRQLNVFCKTYCQVVHLFQGWFGRTMKGIRWVSHSTHTRT